MCDFTAHWEFGGKMSAEKLMLIDGNSIINRAFYGLKGPALLATSEGLYTNAVYGFINILYKFLEEEKPQYLCVAFDLKAPTFRHKEYTAYKANRKGMPQELAVQMPILKETLDAMNIKRVELEGYEADDIIGTLSFEAEKRGIEAVIVTGDRDSFQLASEMTRIKLPTTRGGKTETEEYDLSRILEKYGVSPTEFIDVKGLMGDPSDNIPGVPGIGEKTALDLIKKFNALETLYDNLDKVEKKGVREKLETNRELAFLSKRLATIDRNVPGGWTMDDLKRKDADRPKLLELFKRLEFKSLIDKFCLNEGTNEEPCADTTRDFINIKENSQLKDIISEIKAAGQCAVYYLIDKIDDFSSRLTAFAVTWNEEKSAYIDLNNVLNEDEVLTAFKEIFEDEKIKISGHDIKNLIVYLRNKGIHIKGISFDTLVAAYLLSPTSDTYSVAELAEKYLSTRIEPIEALSGKGKSFVHYRDMDEEKLGAVAVLHSYTVYMLKSVFEAKLHENQQDELFFDIELPLVEVLAGMEYWGFKVNPKDLKRFSEELEERINILIKDIYELAGEEFNINSTKQLGVILFEKLELPIIKKTKTGYSTDAEVLEQLEPKHEIVAKILEYRQLMKLKSTYADGLMGVINPYTGRIHSKFNQSVTATGRISSTEPNLQNIPIKLEMGRKIRKVFVPENDDYILLDADYSQIELRILAHITGDENMIAAFRNDEDIHTTTASRVFGVPKDEVSSLLRSRAKAVNFGIVYGIGDFSLSKDIGVTRKEARKYIDEYLDKYPNVKKYMHDIVKEGKENGFVTTLFNRRRYIPELQSSNFNLRSFGERVAMNTPIQGSAADIIKIAMVRVHKELERRKLKSRLLLQVHDELIIETFKGEMEEVSAIMKEGMEKAIKLEVPLNVDIKAGSNWYESK